MKISIFTILLIIHGLLWVWHSVDKPEFTQLNFDTIILYYHQLWFLQGMFIILLIADIFYDLLRSK